MELLELLLLGLGFLYIIMFSVYFCYGLDNIEEKIGVGYTRRHLKMWFLLSIFEALVILWMYIFY